MKTLILIALASGLCARGFAEEAATPPASPAPSTPPDPAQTVPRALSYLVEKGRDWMDDQNCASCHHMPMMIWSFREAKAGGFPIDEKVLAKAIDWTLSAKVDAKAFSVDKDSGKEQLSIPTAYLALALAGNEGVPLEWSAKAFGNALSNQQPDGAWTVSAGRPPISPPNAAHISLLVANALAANPCSKVDTAASIAWEKALAWLATQPPDDETQSHAFRLLLGARLAQPPAKDSLEWLRARQNGDGGWSQVKDTPSDAHATGQAVYALSSAGIPCDDAAIQRARDFLTKTQSADGSWPMASRPNEPGKGGAKNLEPITYTSTAWAVMALARSQPRK